ncbi:MAG: hypothetical protein HEQ35_08480 [Gloeotrichia echinulata IR180]|jgi:hypothetical protein
MQYQLIFKRNHHYWGLQTGVITEGGFSECQARKTMLESLFAGWCFELEILDIRI